MAGATRGGTGEAARDEAQRRRKRLVQLLSLALAYRGCSRKELARVLGRDPTKLVPGTGIPKLDIIVELASVLDWPVGDIVTHLWGRPVNGCPRRRGGAPGAPEAPDATAGLREAVCWRRAGRYLDVVEAADRGLLEPGASPALRRSLQVMLGEAYYALWSLVEARSIARDLLDACGRRRPQTIGERRRHAFAALLAGQARRRLMAIEPQRSGALAAEARGHLDSALVLYRRLALERDDPAAEGLANTCVGALLETDTALGTRPAVEALTRIAAGLERTRDASQLSPQRLESFGWWCIYGCNIALRHLDDQDQLHQYMAIFTNRADEIANHLDDWAMRERVFTMQYTHGQRAGGATSFRIPRVIDVDDVRIIAGTMGRFPAFRPTGWRILETARIVEAG